MEKKLILGLIILFSVQFANAGNELLKCIGKNIIKTNSCLLPALTFSLSVAVASVNIADCVEIYIKSFGLDGFGHMVGFTISKTGFLVSIVAGLIITTRMLDLVEFESET